MTRGSGKRAAAGWLACGAMALMGASCGPRPALRESSVRDKIMLGDRLIQAESYDEAINVLSQAVHLDPKNAEGFYYLGVSHFYKNDFPEAEKALKESLRLGKRNPDAHNALGLVYAVTNRKSEAMEEYKTALADPTYQARENAYMNLGICLDELGQTEEAISNLRRAVEMNPKYYPAHWELAKVLDRQDQTREAIEEYEVAAPQYASDPNYHYRLGLAYFREHKIDRAREHLTKVIETMPGSEKAVKARELLNLMGPAPAAPPQVQNNGQTGRR